MTRPQIGLPTTPHEHRTKSKSLIEGMVNKDEKMKRSRLIDPRGFKLPASNALLDETTDLDRAETFVKQDLDFLRPSQKRRQRRETANQYEPDWSKLEQCIPREKAQSARKGDEDENWHDMPVADLTPELQRDLRVIENRQYLDPKRFYKSSGTGRKKGELPSRVQVGTILSGAHEFYSSRLSKKDRRARIIDQVLSSEKTVQYATSRFSKLQKQRIDNRRIVDPAFKKRRHRKRR
ncbi:Fcf2 pre-rRNA processing protein [Gracilaria domingensis]|nr:Fcf2 pre-rRNA processing protein [Gracilaria domingensis]